MTKGMGLMVKHLFNFRTLCLNWFQSIPEDVAAKLSRLFPQGLRKYWRQRLKDPRRFMQAARRSAETGFGSATGYLRTNVLLTLFAPPRRIAAEVFQNPLPSGLTWRIPGSGILANLVRDGEPSECIDQRAFQLRQLVGAKKERD